MYCTIEANYTDTKHARLLRDSWATCIQLLNSIGLKFLVTKNGSSVWLSAITLPWTLQQAMYCFWLPVFITAFVTLLVTIFIYWRIQGVGNPAMPPQPELAPQPSSACGPRKRVWKSQICGSKSQRSRSHEVEDRFGGMTKAFSTPLGRYVLRHFLIYLVERNCLLCAL